MKRIFLFAPALIGALALASCTGQTTTTETTTTGDTAVMIDATTPASDPAMTNTSTTTVTTDRSASVGVDSTTGQRLETDAENTGQDIKAGYKDARDATADAASKVGHDVKQGYKNTRDDIKAGVDAAKDNKERR